MTLQLNGHELQMKKMQRNQPQQGLSTLNRFKRALEARKVVRQQAQLVRNGKKWGKIAGEAIASCTLLTKLDEVIIPPDQAAVLCGFVYGFSDVCCQHAGLERGGPASRYAAETGLNIVLNDHSKATQMIKLFLVAREKRAEFERGALIGEAGARGFLNKAPWTEELISIVRTLIEQSELSPASRIHSRCR